MVLCFTALGFSPQLRAQPPIIVAQPANVTVVAQSPATFAVTATGSGPALLTYQWRKDGTAISGATAATYTIASAQAANAGAYSVVVTNPSGSVTSAVASLTVTPAIAPAITAQPLSLANVTGQNVSFSVTATGTAPLAYQWRKNGTAIAAATTAALALVGITAADAADYSVVVSNSAGAITSAVATLTVSAIVPPPLSITTQPVAVTGAIPYGTITFTVSAQASNGQPLTYQWRKNGTAITGATGATLTLFNVQSVDTGTYSVVVSAGPSSINSVDVGLSLSAPGGPARVVTQPVSVFVAAGSAATFSVTATGLAPVSYQWHKDGATIPGATASTYTLASVQTADVGSYTVAVTNSIGTATSTAAVLSLGTTPPPILPFPAPTMGVQPTPAVVAAGATATFTATVNFNGAPTMLYYWVKNGQPLSERLSSSSSTVTLTVPNAQIINEGDYALDVITAGGSVRSVGARLSVHQAPVFITQPQNLTVSQNLAVNLFANASGEPAPTFQWFRNNVVVTGATSKTLTFATAQVTHAGSYTVVATNSAGSATSSPGVLSILAVVDSAQTGSSVIGGEVTLSVTAVGPNLTYRWSRGAVDIPGAQGATLTLRNLSATDGGSYEVYVASGSSLVRAIFLVNLSAVPVSPTVLVQPFGQAAAEGSSVTFTARAGGTGPISLQWLKDGVPIAGATTSNLTLAAVQPGDAGTYRLVFTNAAGTAASDLAILTISAAPTAPRIVVQPSAQIAAVDAPATFAVSAVGTAPFTYQWHRNGTALPGATNATFLIPSVQLTDAANYSVVVTNAVGTVTSSAVALTVTATNFAGTYLGQLGANPADRFALVVRADGTAVFYGYASSPPTGYVATNFQINADGTFTADLTDAKAGADTPARAAFSTPTSVSEAAVTSLAFAGSVASGALAGTIPGTSLTLAAAKSPATGPAHAFAGIYQTAALNRSMGALTTIVDASGQVFMFSQTATGITAGTGTLNPSTGKLAVTLADNSQATATLNPAAGSAIASVTTAAKETISFAGLADGIARTDRLVNLASRGAVSASDLMIAGFVITGTSPKSVMIRATGPALTAFGLGGTLANPKLELYRGSERIQENDDWSLATNAADIPSAAARTGAFPLVAGSRDAVLFTSLAPGGYTAQVSSVGGTAGVALVEVYDAGEAAITPATPRLVNISTRAAVAGGESLLIAGIVITGNAPKQILIRATGPALTAFGLPGALADPLLKLFRGDVLLKQNDNWSDSVADAALITTAGKGTGAFALTSGSKDAALLLTLEPGSYTAQVSGVGLGTGVALVEVYEVP